MEEGPQITSVQVYSDTKDELERLKIRKESYDDVIRRLIEESDND